MIKSHSQIVRELHARHKNDNHDPNKHWESCPFCDRIRNEFLERLYMYLEEPLVDLLKKTADHWVREGVQIGNDISGHRMVTYTALEILQDWIQIPNAVLDDIPEEYLEHPIVENLYHAQHKWKEVAVVLADVARQWKSIRNVITGRRCVVEVWS